MNKPYLLSNKRVLEMEKTGWFLMISEFREDDTELYNRLIKRYKQVKVYYTTTGVKGYYRLFAMVK